MKLSLNWLRDYVEVKLTTDELVARLTMAGLEVEAVETVGKDTVLEIEITPNRPDCLNVLGLAREVGAITSKSVKFPKIKLPKPVGKKFPTVVSDKNDCRRYVATLVSGVKVGAGPAMIEDRLASMGVRAINNAVDVTNFILFEKGQPLHVFDYDKIVGGKVVVRRAKAGETLVTIDGIKRTLDPSILVIADSQHPIAIAGLMGGKATEVTAQTTNILLEAAHFDMGIIRRASRKLGLKSDASYRFERNVNCHGVSEAASRAVELLLESAGGKVTARSDINHVKKSLAKPFKLTGKDIERLLGTAISLKRAKDILTRLGFIVRGQAQQLLIKTPAFRGDIGSTEDLIEEVARVVGYDKLPTSMPMINAVNIQPDQRPREIKACIRRALLSSGIDEAIGYSMTSRKNVARSGLHSLASIAVTNPLSAEQEILRPHLLPTLLPVLVLNLNRGNRDVRLFEIGNVFSPAGEITALAIIMTGRRYTDWRLSRKEVIEFTDIKGRIEHLAQQLGVALIFKADSAGGFDESATAAIEHAGRVIGHVGAINKDVLSQWDIKGAAVFAAYVNIQSLIERPMPIVKFQALNDFPGMVRDVSVAVKTDVVFADIVAHCRVQGGALLKEVNFVEEYTGDKIQAGLKGLVFSCLYQSSSRTLREEEVQTSHSRIVETLKSSLGAIQR